MNTINRMNDGSGLTDIDIANLALTLNVLESGSATASVQSGIQFIVTTKGNFSPAGANSGSYYGSVFTGSVIISGSISSSRYDGDGGGLFNIPASALEDLQLDRIKSGSVQAVISPNLGLQIGTRTFVSGNLSVTGGLFVTGGNVVVTSGSTFIGDGSGLTNINIANLSFETFILRSGSVTASISPDKGFVVNTSSFVWGDSYVDRNLRANTITGSSYIFSPLFTGSFLGTYNFKGVGPTASAQYDILRYDENRGYFVPQPETSLTETVSFNNVSDLTIVHNLDIRYPIVQVYATGSEDQILPGTIKSIDDDTIQIVFSGLTSGHAVIGSGGSLINGSINGDRVFGEVLSASAIQEAGIEYKDLPAETPVDVRTDENGNAVVITAEVAAQIELLENPGELLATAFSDPGAALEALGSIGADMSDEEREEATEMVVAAVVAAGAAINAVGAAAGAGAATTGAATGVGAAAGVALRPLRSM